MLRLTWAVIFVEARALRHALLCLFCRSIIGQQPTMPTKGALEEGLGNLPARPWTGTLLAPLEGCTPPAPAVLFYKYHLADVCLGVRVGVGVVDEGAAAAADRAPRLLTHGACSVQWMASAPGMTRSPDSFTAAGTSELILPLPLSSLSHQPHHPSFPAPATACFCYCLLQLTCCFRFECVVPSFLTVPSVRPTTGYCQ